MAEVLSEEEQGKADIWLVYRMLSSVGRWRPSPGGHSCQAHISRESGGS